MDSAELPRVFYLVILGAAVLGWLVAENRGNLGRTLRMALVWGLIFLGVVAGYGLWGDIRNEVLPRQSVIGDGARIEVPRGRDGHFHLAAEVNGVPVDFLVDTGATDVVLSLDDARAVGLDPDGLAFLGTARTANGEVRTATATVDRIAIGPVGFDRVRVSVNGGDMRESLLGMSFLNRFGRLEMSGGRLTLEP